MGQESTKGEYMLGKGGMVRVFILEVTKEDRVRATERLTCLKLPNHILSSTAALANHHTFETIQIYYLTVLLVRNSIQVSLG